jgi:hypothetical protein
MTGRPAAGLTAGPTSDGAITASATPVNNVLASSQARARPGGPNTASSPPAAAIMIPRFGVHDP